MKTLLGFLLSALLCVFSAVAAEESAKPATSTSSFSIPENVTDKELAAMNEKMSCYVQILNDFGSMQFVDAIKERLELLKDKKRGTNWPVRRLTGGYSPRFDAALKKNASLLPGIEPADTAMEQLASAYPRLKENLAALDQYHQRGDNKDDSGKKGLELGALLQKDFDIFMNAHAVIESEFIKNSDTLKDFSLARFEKAHGKKFYWHNSMLMKQAFKLVSLAPPRMENFNAQAFEAAFKEFQSIVNEYEGYIKAAGADLKKEANNAVRSNWISEFISASRTLMESKEKSIPRKYTNFVGVLHSQYNNMVSDSNGITFIIPPKQ